MLDHRLFLNDLEGTIAALKKRSVDAEVLEKASALADARRHLIKRLDDLRHEMNQASDAMKEKAKAGDTEAIEASRHRLKTLKLEIKAQEEAETGTDDELRQLMMDLPNLPHESVPSGSDESDNRQERLEGKKPTLDFEPKPHWEIGENLGILDFESAAKISGSRFVVYRDAGARLERALANFMLDVAREKGFTEIMPPLLVRREAMVGSGQFPKFEGESFETLDNEYVLIPTSEVPLVNLHREEIIDEDKLPLRYAAFTPCFRREAGSAGKDTRGLIRQHQFNKVELVALCDPEKSFDELERLTGCAEEVLKRLGLHYRVMALCAGDMGFAATKTYDLEVWLPGQDAFREISSCSNCSDFQARRAKIRYRPTEGKKPKPKLLHSLNGSGLAVGRTVVAILENYQRADGSVEIPVALRSYFGADEILAPQ